MDIEEQKRKFLDFLRIVYKARLVTTGRWIVETNRNKELLQISEDNLTTHGFDGHDFWYLICPSLQTDGFLKNYIEPPMFSDSGYIPTFEINHEKLFTSLDKNNQKVSKVSGDNVFIFELTKDGTLSLEGSNKKSSTYSIEKGSRRHNIFKELIAHDAFCDTKQRAKRVECTPKEFSKDVNGLRKLMKKHFGTKTMDVIESKQRSGYRINPKTHIIPVS